MDKWPEDYECDGQISMFDGKDVNKVNEVERKIALWLQRHDGEYFCHYCILNNDCPQDIVCYGGNPIEPPCWSLDYEGKLLNKNALYEDIKNGEWD